MLYIFCGVAAVLILASLLAGWKLYDKLEELEILASEKDQSLPSYKNIGDSTASSIEKDGSERSVSFF